VNKRAVFVAEILQVNLVTIVYSGALLTCCRDRSVRNRRPFRPVRMNRSLADWCVFQFSSPCLFVYLLETFYSGPSTWSTTVLTAERLPEQRSFRLLSV